MRLCHTVGFVATLRRHFVFLQFRRPRPAARHRNEEPSHRGHEQSGAGSGRSWNFRQQTEAVSTTFLSMDKNKTFTAADVQSANLTIVKQIVRVTNSYKAR